MKPSRRTRLIGAILVTALLSGILIQGRQIAILRTEAETRGVVRQVQAVTPTTPATDALPGKATPLSEAEHLRLLALRREAGQLRQQKSGMTTLRAENQRLKTAVAQPIRTRASDGSNTYVPATKATFAGYTTPAATMQSFVWALKNHDTNALIQALTPDSAATLWTALETQGVEKFFEDAGRFPGFRIRSVTGRSDGSAEAEIQMDPTSEESSTKFTFQNINGVWKLNLP